MKHEEKVFGISIWSPFWPRLIASLYGLTIIFLAASAYFLVAQ